jgi:hypothetical protein
MGGVVPPKLTGFARPLAMGVLIRMGGVGWKIPQKGGAEENVMVTESGRRTARRKEWAIRHREGDSLVIV